MNAPAPLATEVAALLQQDRLEEAEARLRPALATGSAPILLWKQLIQAIRPRGMLEETLRIQEQLVTAIPGDPVGRFDLAETLLLMGEFERGWREYQWRYSLPHTTRIERKVQKPRWSGAPIPGKTLLIHDEQGFGDTFQFLRMVPWAKERSQARIILEVHPACLGLAERTTGWDELIPRGSLPPAFDQHCELMSLPMTTGLTLDKLPGPIPYLTPHRGRLAKWRKKLARLNRPLVALVWAGSPGHLNDANRSLPLERLAPLAIPGITFVALQKGPAAGQTPPAGMDVLSLDQDIHDFEDTAAILEIADLLISVDSSPIHLAGALNRPAWVLLPFVPDWRWLMKREDCPWYPSVRLFRQTSRGDWDNVLTRMADALAQWRDALPHAGRRP